MASGPGAGPRARAPQALKQSLHMGRAHPVRRGPPQRSGGGALLRNNANPLDALVPLRTAWERAPDQPETWTAWAAELSLVGETAEAAKRLQEALVMWPDNQPLQHVAALLAPKPQ